MARGQRPPSLSFRIHRECASGLEAESREFSSSSKSDLELNFQDGFFIGGKKGIFICSSERVLDREGYGNERHRITGRRHFDNFFIELLVVFCGRQ
ncbi:hypothetical protein TNIN_252011 [Trichonephila inaurata madagascariensis]|uniref:Uncharacterized protein n=1 Tax=Trichonephila inaurata madagascariensis TaxID=2747483 RepID=A0A8X7BU11_9ARAC|nr:hypothetical protein TNIN_252011 [Trichonephila inaurata madagascariensis]